MNVNTFERLEQEETRLIALYLDSEDAAEADAILEKIAAMQMAMLALDVRRDMPC